MADAARASYLNFDLFLATKPASEDAEEPGEAHSIGKSKPKGQGHDCGSLHQPIWLKSHVRQLQHHIKAARTSVTKQRYIRTSASAKILVAKHSETMVRCQPHCALVMRGRDLRDRDKENIIQR